MKTCSICLLSRWCVRYGTGMPGTGMDVAPKLSKCPVPVLISYRSYRSVRYRYWWRTQLTEVSGTGNTGGIYRRYDSVPNIPNTPFFVCYPFDYQLKRKVKKRNAESPWTWKKTNNLHFLLVGWFYIMRIWFRAYFGQVAKTNLVCANRNRLLVRNGRGDGTHAICLFARGILQQFS